MNANAIFMKDWLELHPYNHQLDSDMFFLKLSNKLFDVIDIKDIPTQIKKRSALYVAAYLEDIISGLGLWHAFLQENQKLYSKYIPFYEIGENYIDDEINVEDIRFILWYTLYKAEFSSEPIDPMSNEIKQSAEKMFDILDDVFETAPENEALRYFFYDYDSKEDALAKIDWLFRKSYLIQPSILGYEISDNDKYIIPCGPLALFLYEWIELLSENNNNKWKEIKELYPPTPILPKEVLKKNENTYKLFTEGNNEKTIVYIDGYDNLRLFLINVLKWPDQESHMLPQMKEFKNYILMVNKEKGILLAHSICESIKDPLNSMYNKDIAEKEAFSLLTVPRKCPPDLLNYVIENKYLPDAQFPVFGEKKLVEQNADFIARCSLLYFYKGD